MDRSRLTSLVRCSVCAALMAVCAWVTVPVGDTVITLQTFALFFSLAFLGGGRGTAVCLVYLTLGALGLPVFSGFQGGMGAVLGPTGGFLLGFLLTALWVWLLEGRLPVWLNLTLGLLLCYLCGSLWYYFLYTEGGLWAVVLKCVLPCILPDALKLWLALTVRKRIKI